DGNPSSAKRTPPQPGVLLVTTGNRLGVNELIEPPGAAPETQPKLAGLAQTEHTLTPTKTALISPLCLAPPVPDPIQPRHETHGGNGCWGQGVR
ncbi:hypothetical protein M9458_020229, partial [Cirrhinus mrigala]